MWRVVGMLGRKKIKRRRRNKELLHKVLKKVKKAHFLRDLFKKKKINFFYNLKKKLFL